MSLTLLDASSNLPDLSVRNHFIWEFTFNDFDVARDAHLWLVSCVDMLAVTTRDLVTMVDGTYYIFLGHKDEEMQWFVRESEREREEERERERGDDGFAESERGRRK